MDHYKYKAADEGYFTQQAIRAGYIASPDHSQHQPADMREAIVREIEKERVREKIIAEEIARRRMVESEVRRELVMERQLAKQSGEGLSPCSSSSSLPFLKQQRKELHLHR
uniref:Uncharacterized protein n=1 Tax=Solanum lycopersicum TaxID=4081 RepID=A0A3Q7H6F7_SOLLC